MHRCFFLIFEEFHSTIGSIRKNLEHLVGLLGARQNQGEVRFYHGFLVSETFCFFLMLPFFKRICYCFFNVNYWQYFLLTAPVMTAPIYVHLRPKVDTVCFQRPNRFSWLWGRVLLKFNWILVFCLQLFFFWQSDF